MQKITSLLTQSWKPAFSCWHNPFRSFLTHILTPNQSLHIPKFFNTWITSTKSQFFTVRCWTVTSNSHSWIIYPTLIDCDYADVLGRSREYLPRIISYRTLTSDLSIRTWQGSKCPSLFTFAIVFNLKRISIKWNLLMWYFIWW